MKKIRVFLTFDYELPLGGITKSYDHSLFDPTYRLIDLAKKIGVPITFFADILSYNKFKEWNVPEYYEQFDKQIQYALLNNVDVQLHLHPHWIDSKFENGKFIPATSFALGDFEENKYPDNIEGIVENGCNSLNDLCSKSIPGYRCLAFRAGGYNLFPYTERILKALFKNGIRIDTSISRGYYYKSDFSLIDYRNVPAKPNWFLDFQGDFGKESTNGIYEIPIASKPKGMFEVPTKFKLKKYEYRAVENRGKMIHVNENVNFKDKIKQLFSSRMLTVDNHTYSHEYLLKILEYNINKFKSFDTIDLSLIGHPKSMGDYSFELFTEFVNRSKDKYKSNIEFCSFSSQF